MAAVSPERRGDGCAPYTASSQCPRGGEGEVVPATCAGGGPVSRGGTRQCDHSDCTSAGRCQDRCTCPNHPMAALQLRHVKLPFVDRLLRSTNDHRARLLPLGSARITWGQRRQFAGRWAATRQGSQLVECERDGVELGERRRPEGPLLRWGSTNQGQMLQFMGVRRPQRDEVTSSGMKADNRLRYGGEWFAAASTLLSDGGSRPGRLARFVAEAARRPRRAGALIALILRTRSEYVCLSESEAGEALRAHFDGRRFAVFPGNRLCQGVLILPRHHAEYLRGHHRQALRTNLRRAATAGIRCERVDDPSVGLATALDMLRRRSDSVSDGDVEFWRARFAQPELMLTFAYDELGHPLAFSGAVIDDTVCLIKFALASDHRARWALHDHLVRILIGRRVTYLLAAGGGAFGALGLAANLQHYQRLLGYELRHMIPATTTPKLLRPRRVAWLVAMAATATLIIPSAATCARDGGPARPTTPDEATRRRSIGAD